MTEPSPHHPPPGPAALQLLEGGLLEPPADFTQRVMARIEPLPMPTRPPRQRWEGLQWLALICGGALGAFQLAAFMFGIWSATAAG